MEPDNKIVEPALIGVLIRERRLSLKWTVEGMAKRVGCSSAMISLTETGVRTPRLPLLLRMLDRVGLKLTIDVDPDNPMSVS